MTTLPQTTQPRAPRPAGTGGGLTTAGPTHQAQPAAPSMTAGDVWRVIRANLWMIVALVAFGLVASFFINWYLEKNFSRYTATGFVQIADKPVGDMFSEGGVRYGLDTTTLPIEQKSQSRSLTTDALYNKVLTDRPAVRDTTWFKQFLRPGPGGTMVPDLAAAREDLSDKIGVVPLQDTKLIEISFTFSVPKDCTIIINELVDEHLEEQGRAFEELNTVREQDLSSTWNALKLQQNSLQEDINQLQKDLNEEGISPESNHFSPREMKLDNLSGQQRELQHDFTLYKSNIDSLKDELSKGEDPAEVDEAVDRDSHLDEMRRSLDDYRSAVSSMSSLGDNNPKYRGAQQELAQRENDMKDQEDEVRAKQRDILLGKATRDFESSKAALEGVNQEMESEQATAGEIDLKLYKLTVDQEQIKSVNEQVETVRKQLTEIENENKGRDRTTLEWANRPETPDTPSFPNVKWSLSFGGFAGLLIGFGIAFGREMLDQTVRSPRDITRVGQMNLLGMIPHEDDDPQVANVPLPMVIFQAPTSIIAEQYRQVRTRLQQAASLDATHSILVTSPSPGDGKSVVACNLAAGLALNGRRILLVDANFRRPQIAKIFNVGNDIGFSNVLGSLDNFESAVKQTTVPNLDVLPTGPKPANPTELMESQLLTDFIEKALEEYDHVIFDSGPLLFVSETVALAPRVDGVVTVVRARTNSRGLLQRMRDALRQLKAEHLGVVLNAVRSQGGGYYGRNIKTYYEYQNGHAS